jgi:poly(A) polymerase
MAGTGDQPTVDGPWLHDPGVGAIFDALGQGEAGSGDVARFVGGCVRNALIGAPVGDIDIATALVPEDVVERLTAAGLKAVPTGIEHGTVTAVADGTPVEITTLRRDVETDGRHAVVAFTTDWAEDAARRDFTMNALYADRDGRLIDLVGGVADAKVGRVRFVGDPDRRIAEDYLRVLRYFRFLAHYGREEPDAATLAALRDGAPGLDRLAAERIRVELLKLLAAPLDGVVRAWRLIEATGVDRHVLGQAGDVDRLAGLGATGHDRPDGMLRLAALTADEGDPRAPDLAQRLRLSNAEARRLAAIEQALADAPFAALDADYAREAAYWRGADAMWDALVVFAAAGGIGPVGLQALAGWQPPVFPLGGVDAKAAGLSPGPEMGEALRATEQWWAASGFPDDRQACLDFLKGVAGLPP